MVLPRGQGGENSFQGDFDGSPVAASRDQCGWWKRFKPGCTLQAEHGACPQLDLAQEASSCWWGCPEILQISDGPDQPEVKGVQGQRSTLRGLKWRTHSWEVPLALVLG